MSNDVKLGDVVEIIMGQAPPGKKCNKEGVGTPFVKVGEFGDLRPIIREWTTDPKRLAKAGDVLLCVVGATCGKINLGINCSIGRSVAAIRPLEGKILQPYLYYFMTTMILKMRSGSLGAAQTVISKDMIKSVDIPLPSLSEQKQIVEILDAAFAGIDKAIENTQTNLANAQELFDSYLNATFTKHGDGWEDYPLKDICEIRPPKSEIKDKLTDTDEVSFVPMNDLGICEKDFAAHGKRKLKDVISSYTYFADGDVLLAKITPCFENGKLGVARNLMNGVGFGSSEFVVFRPNKSLLSDFLFYFLSRPAFRREGEVNMGGAVGHKRVKKEFIENYRISFPSIEQQKELLDNIDTLSSCINSMHAKYEKKLHSLNELKQSILQKAFSGELTGDAINEVREAVA